MPKRPFPSAWPWRSGAVAQWRSGSRGSRWGLALRLAHELLARNTTRDTSRGDLRPLVSLMASDPPQALLTPPLFTLQFAVCALLPLHDRPTTIGDPERCVRLPRHLATSAVQRFCVLPQHRPCARHTTQGQLPRSASNGTPPKANYRRVPPMATAAQTPWKSRGQRVASCRRRSAGVAHAAIRGP